MRELQASRDRILALEREVEHANKLALKHSAEFARLEATQEDAVAKVCVDTHTDTHMYSRARAHPLSSTHIYTTYSPAGLLNPKLQNSNPKTQTLNPDPSAFYPKPQRIPSARQ